MLFVKFVNTLSAYFCFRCKKKLNENGQKTGRARTRAQDMLYLRDRSVKKVGLNI